MGGLLVGGDRKLVLAQFRLDFADEAMGGGEVGFDAEGFLSSGDRLIPLALNQQEQGLC